MKCSLKETFTHNVDAEKICTELEVLGQALTPAQVVKLAEDEMLEVHKCFEWDGDKAAISYRLDQARQLLNHIIFTVETESGETISTRKYQSVPTDEGRRYMATYAVIDNPSMLESVKDDILSVIGALQKRIDDLNKLVPQETQVDPRPLFQVQEEVQAVQPQA